MNEEQYKLSPNLVVKYLDKPAAEFTKEDIMTFVEHNQIEMLNFHYIAEDGRLKTLNFVINNKAHLDQILSSGERVDGSSLFSHIGAGSSDLYVIPRYKTAFIDPFSEVPTLSLLCSFFTKDGTYLESAPNRILQKANKALKDNTGYEFYAMGELEYYVISDESDLYPTSDQKGYHESSPFNKMAEFRKEAMYLIAQCGGDIKYGHSEVGNFVQNGKNYEQNEIEFVPTTVEEAADQLIIAKWILRNIAYEFGFTITFSPKITVGKAGSGMHVHTRLVKDGKNAMVKDMKLTDAAKKAIAGYLELAPSLTAFGNRNPSSYFRLVPHQEAPTNICWGDRNRSTLVRVPLGWTVEADMASIANPIEKKNLKDYSYKQTAEFRCSDGTADIYLLMAGLCVAARHGLEMENALELAEKTYVDVDIFEDEHKAKQDSLDTLPASCSESADMLEKHIDIYTKYDVFTKDILQRNIDNLKSFNDKGLREKLEKDNDALINFIEKYFHCG